MAEGDVSAYASLSAAKLRLNNAGYCVLCDRIVVRDGAGACPAGHPSEAITGKILLGSTEPVPQLPRFNLAAFALPPVWGPAHGQWAGVFFLPIWLFADSAVANAGRSGLTAAAAAVVVVGTVAFQAFFAKRANGTAWRRVCAEVTIDEFARRQRTWALACVPAGVALLTWGLYYRFVLA